MTISQVVAELKLAGGDKLSIVRAYAMMRGLLNCSFETFVRHVMGVARPDIVAIQTSDVLHPLTDDAKAGLLASYLDSLDSGEKWSVIEFLDALAVSVARTTEKVSVRNEMEQFVDSMLAAPVPVMPPVQAESFRGPQGPPGSTGQLGYYVPQPQAMAYGVVPMQPAMAPVSSPAVRSQYDPMLGVATPNPALAPVGNPVSETTDLPEYVDTEEDMDEPESSPTVSSITSEGWPQPGDRVCYTMGSQEITGTVIGRAGRHVDIFCDSGEEYQQVSTQYLTETDQVEVSLKVPLSIETLKEWASKTDDDLPIAEDDPVLCSAGVLRSVITPLGSSAGLSLDLVYGPAEEPGLFVELRLSSDSDEFDDITNYLKLSENISIAELKDIIFRVSSEGVWFSSLRKYTLDVEILGDPSTPKAHSRKGEEMTASAAKVPATGEKRKPGRPRKPETAAATSASAPARGPGRPRKVDTAVSTEPKRGRGRPRKTETAAEAPAPARGPGRPRKVDTAVSDEPKRGRGRPRKTDATGTDD